MSFPPFLKSIEQAPRQMSFANVSGKFSIRETESAGKHNMTTKEITRIFRVDSFFDVEQNDAFGLDSAACKSPLQNAFHSKLPLSLSGDIFIDMQLARVNAISNKICLLGTR